MIGLIIYIAGLIVVAIMTAMVHRLVSDSLIRKVVDYVKKHPVKEQSDDLNTELYYIFLIACHIFWPITLLSFIISGLVRLWIWAAKVRGRGRT